MIRAITQRTIYNFKQRKEPYDVRDPKLTGFMLRVQPSGIRTYWFDARLPKTGKRTRIKIGRVTDISVGDAQAQAKRLAQAVAGQKAELALNSKLFNELGKLSAKDKLDLKQAVKDVATGTSIFFPKRRARTGRSRIKRGRR